MANNNIAIIGLGRWGKNLLRNFRALKNVSIKYLFDKDKKVFDSINPGGAKTAENYLQILKDKEVDSLVIATDIKTHYRLAKEALSYNKNVFVEKPLSGKKEEVKELIGLARKKSLVLFVDYLYFYSPAVKKIKEIINSGALGPIRSIRAVRFHPVRPGPIRDNVVIDLFPHDFSILSFLLNDFPDKVFSFSLPEEADIILHYKSGLVADIGLSRASFKKRRTYCISGEKGLIVWDEVNCPGRLKIYNPQAEIIKTENSEPLAECCRDFIRRCQDKNLPDSKVSIEFVKAYKKIWESN